MDRTVYIIIVNWHGWQDTIECLESLFKLTNQSFKVIVCDNGSSDASLERIQLWANGKLKVSASVPEMVVYSRPEVPKPLMFQLLTKEELELHDVVADTSLVLIDCKENLGFAGACNVGLRFALTQKDMSWVWLLNNDTVVDHDALSHLVEKIEQNPEAGMVGSTLVHYYQVDRVQAFGGARYFHCLGLAMHIGRFHSCRRIVNEQLIERQMHYVVGASLFVTRKFIETIGFMSEDYFLYYEELDWALRACGIFRLAYSQKSIVYHKMGKSIGSSSKIANRSLFSDYYLISNRLRITRHFFPHCMLSVRIVLFFEMAIRIVQGQVDHAAMIWKLITNQQVNVEHFQ
jgi:GT2 family glycosyltransferase